jgi:hypothetical protein
VAGVQKKSDNDPAYFIYSYGYISLQETYLGTFVREEREPLPVDQHLHQRIVGQQRCIFYYHLYLLHPVISFDLLALLANQFRMSSNRAAERLALTLTSLHHGGRKDKKIWAQGRTRR